MSDVPMEIVTDILLRLPVKPLLCFRSVCKPWCALIDSPDFVKSHLDQSLQNNTNRSLFLGVGCLRSVDFDSLDTAVERAHPITRKVDDETQILASCHGLLCLLIGEDEFALWNPATRWHKKLPANDFSFQTVYYSPGNYFFIYGFGYDRVKDDYKVVRIIQFYLEDTETFDSQVEVYSSRTNSWWTIQEFPYNISQKQDYGVLANGALHWAVSQKPLSDVADLIAAFDLESEEFRLVPHPQYAENGIDMNVGVLGDCLCVNCYDHDQQYFDVWVMNEYGVKDSWTKLLSIAPHEDIGSFEYLKPIAYSKTDVQILFRMSEDIKYSSGDSGFFWYDLEKKIVQPIVINGAPDYFEAFICIESLVRLNKSSKRDAKMLGKRGSLMKRRRGLL